MMLLNKFLFPIIFILLLLIASCSKTSKIGDTKITKWQYDKKSAISITYDDGYITQFKNAMPIMDRLGFPGTFFIVTGAMRGSEYHPKFKGRPVKKIIRDTKTTPTNEENFFERASALNYLDYKGTLKYHRQAGSLFESGDTEEAYKVVDEVYARVRDGGFKSGADMSPEAEGTARNTWKEFQNYTEQGHEFASHTITHPRLAVLSEKNLLYELKKSREDILNHLGPNHTFSVEGPFGTDDKRVMKHLVDIYPATRNTMPHPWLEEIHRSDDMQPGNAEKEYIQWQRGPLSDTPMELMKSWVDTTLTHDNIWLVLVFHGVDGVGWEPIPSEKLEDYFIYMKKREDDLWVATFGDVTKYIRERMNTEIHSIYEDNIITVDSKLTMNPAYYIERSRYDMNLTFKTYVPKDWSSVIFEQNDKQEQLQVIVDNLGHCVMYQAIPGGGQITITKYTPN